MHDAGIDPIDDARAESSPAAAARVRALPNGLAIALVAGTSGAVLVLEILAGRVLAPYVGVNLETYTAIIGTILAGIALGAWAGGVAADRVDPRGLIPLLLVAGGGLAIASIPIVRALGGEAGPGDAGAPSVLLALWGFGPSAAVLSAVPPAVVKLQLRDLDRTGTTVGHLSAWGTGGAIAGTFVAGYVLVAFAAVTTLIVTVGVLLAVAGALFWIADRVAPPNLMLSAGGLVAIAALGAVATDDPCDFRSSYYCVSIDEDPDRESGRILVLDDLRHSYVDLDDPTHLEFWYVRRITEAIDALALAGPLDVVTVGAGAMTVPQWVRATRPGSRQVVLELDGDLVEVVDDELPPADGGTFAGAADIDVVVGDGRRTMRTLPDDSADVIVGDAFGSRAVPWHLTTEEFMDDVARVLRPDGIYVVNVIDGGRESFLRAKAATMRTAMPHVAVVRSPGVVDGFVANSVVVASAEPFDQGEWEAAAVRDGAEPVDDVDAYLADARVLTDDFAPVDQLIAGVGRGSDR